MPLTVYVPSTVYNTRFNTVYEVSKLRIVSNYATQLDIEYHDPDTNSIYTRISVPTRILRGVATEFIGFTRTPATPSQAQATQPATRTTQPRATKVPV